MLDRRFFGALPLTFTLPRPLRHGLALSCLSSALLLTATGSAAAPAAAGPTKATAATADDPQRAPLNLGVNAKHALVMDDAGKILLAKNADTVVPIASLTKLLTAMVVIDAQLDMNAPVRIESDDVDRVKHSASHLKVGTKTTRMGALQLALIASENRAAAALARTFPGGPAAFLQAMQAKIRALGLKNTAIAEPTGLSPANTSTAAEIARITAAAARYRDIANITSDAKTQVPINGKPREYRNTNRLVGAKGWDIRVSKTGYIEEAGRCLTMRMKSGGKDVTVVLLDADGSAQRLRDAAKIRQSLTRLHS